MRRALVVTATLILGMLLPLSPATADPIKITGGSAVFDEDAVATVDIQGQQGLRAQFKNLLLNTTGPWQCSPCLPGTTLSPDGFIESIDGAGIVEFRGVSYVLGSTSGDSPGTAVISIRPFGAPVIVPPVVGPRIILTTPFELSSGSILLFTEREDERTELRLSGTGIFTMELIPNRFDPVWQMAKTRYEFSPTPEPATLILMTTAFGILALRRQHTSRNCQP